MPLTINVQPKELFDEDTQRFINVKETKLVMEHSLLSISKWEAKYKKPFLVEGALDTLDKKLYYFECMTINDTMTATWFREDKPKPGSKNGKPKQKEVLTSEVIYWEMIALQIPIEFQKWHLNRLITLIRVCNAKNNPEKMSKKDILAQNAALNKARRAKTHSKG